MKCLWVFIGSSKNEFLFLIEELIETGFDVFEDPDIEYKISSLWKNDSFVGSPGAEDLDDDLVLFVIYFNWVFFCGVILTFFSFFHFILLFFYCIDF